jgi:FtsZ-binding cell division protein ZapB
MSNLIGNSKAVSKVIFAGTIVVFLIALIAIGFMMSARIDAVQTENNILQSQITTLQSTNDQLQNNNQNLQSQYNQLKTSDDNLAASYNALNDQYQTLLSKLPSGGQGITIESIDQRSSNYGIYNVTVRNLSSSDIHVTALKLYSGTLFVSSASVLVTVPSNSATTIHQFVPWNYAWPNSVEYTLKIETLEGYTVTSEPLSINSGS